MATHALPLRFVLGLILMAPQTPRTVPGSAPHRHLLVAPRPGARRMHDELMHIRSGLLMTPQTPRCRDRMVLLVATLAIQIGYRKRGTLGMTLHALHTPV